MLSGVLNFFKSDIKSDIKLDTFGDNYYALGGLRSFQHYVYNKLHIILLGEMHVNMPNILADQYIRVLNEYIETGKHVKVYLERSKDRTSERSEEGLSFMDCLIALPTYSNLEKINADTRNYAEDFTNFFLSVNRLVELADEVKIELKKRNIQSPKGTPFYPNEENIDILYRYADVFEKKFYIKDLCDLLIYEMNVLEELENKYSAKNKNVGLYMAGCILDVNEALGVALKLQDKYILLGNDEKKAETTPLINIVIDLIIHDKNFDPAHAFMSIYFNYAINFLDAKFIASLWDEMQENQDIDMTIMIVQGVEHITHLAKILNTLCSTIRIIDPDREGEIILPVDMKKYLNEHDISSTHESSDISCFLVKLPNDFLIKIFNYCLSDLKAVNRFSMVIESYSRLFKPNLDTVAYQQLMQHIIDDEYEVVQKILISKPYLLLQKPKKNFIIESKKTWQIFHVIEKPLSFALKRCQSGIIKVILPFFDILEKNKVVMNAKKEIFWQWTVREISEEEINQYKNILTNVVNVIAQEDFINGFDGDRLFDRINDETRFMFNAFLNKLLPSDAVTIDDYFDINLLLKVAYKVYISFFYTLNNDQRDFYAVSVIGLILSLLNPERGKIFCEGLYSVVHDNDLISDRANSLMLADEQTSFYRSSRDSLAGHGYDFLVGIYRPKIIEMLDRTFKCPAYLKGLNRNVCITALELFETLHCLKIEELEKLKNDHISSHLYQEQVEEQSYCLTQ